MTFLGILRVSLFVFLAVVARADPKDFLPLVRAHAERHPLLEAQDIYKFLFQACLGAEHAAPDEAGALAWLEREIATMGPGPTEPMTEALTPDGSLVRVHLRPFVARGGDVKQLARAFRATAQRTFGSREDLAHAWQAVVELENAGALALDPSEVREFGERMRAAGFGPVRHSERFRAEYRPAYRVVARDLLPTVAASATDQ